MSSTHQINLLESVLAFCVGRCVSVVARDGHGGDSVADELHAPAHSVASVPHSPLAFCSVPPWSLCSLVDESLRASGSPAAGRRRADSPSRPDERHERERDERAERQRPSHTGTTRTGERVRPALPPPLVALHAWLFLLLPQVAQERAAAARSRTADDEHQTANLMTPSTHQAE
jgi:hypothetical protein